MAKVSVKNYAQNENYDALCVSLEGWMAYASYADTYNLRHRITDLVEANFPGNTSLLQIDRLIKLC